ncbi:MAG: carbon-nitrogen hydrolase family protein [Nitrospinae bacterium]|nr:carbon-nitrogen hydrolase family protein [Nitrospinota bacterium]
MKVAAIQTMAGTDRAANLARAETLLAEAKGRGATLAALPEYFACYGDDATLAASAAGADEVVARMADAARRLKMAIVAGGIVRRPKGADRPVNETLLFDEDGSVVARYRKRKLFAATVNGKRYGEGLWLAPGRNVTVAEQAGWRIGLATCFDLRFPAHFARLRAKGATLIVAPSAFTAATGRAHWAPLVTARAIETQSYVVAPALAGTSQGRAVHGHTMIVDPWGKAETLEDREGMLLATLSASRIEKTRTTIPMGIE